MKEEAREYFIMQKEKKAYIRFLASNLSFANNPDSTLSLQSRSLKKSLNKIKPEYKYFSLS